MLKKGDTPPTRSKKGQKRRTAIALSVGTCLVMGILAMEVIRRQDDASSHLNPSKNQTLIVLKNPDDLKLHRDLNLLESRIQDSKRLLFSRENALETKRVQALRERLNNAEAYAEDLEKRNDQLRLALNNEKQKLSDYDKTATALVDTIELQKNAKETTRQQLLSQLEELKSEYEAEKSHLEKALVERENSEKALNEKLEIKEKELSDLQGALNVKENQFTNVQNESLKVQESQQGLIDEINLIQDRLQENESRALDLEKSLKDSEESYSDKVKSLEEALERTKVSYKEMTDSYASLQSRYHGLEAVLVEKARENETLLTKLDTQRQENDLIAYNADSYADQAGNTLAEQDEALSLQKAYAEVALYRMKQQAQKDEDDRLALEQNLSDLRNQIELRQQEIAEITSESTEKESALKELRELLESERANSEELRYTLANRPPERDLERENTLEKELAYEKECSLRLQSDLSDQINEKDNIEREIALLETSLLESRARSQDLSSTEEALKQEISDLEEKLSLEKRSREELAESLQSQIDQKSSLAQEIQTLSEKLYQAETTQEQNEIALLQDTLKLQETLTSLRKEQDNLSEVLNSERQKKGEFEQEIAYLNNRISNLGLALDDSEATYRTEFTALQETLVAARSEVEALSYQLTEEQSKKGQLEQDIAILEQNLVASTEQYQAKEQTLQSEISLLQNTLDAKTSELEVLSQNLENEQNNKAILQQNLTQLEQELSQSAQDFYVQENALKSYLSQVESTLQELESNLAAKENELANESALKAELEGATALLTDQFNAIQREKNVLENEIREQAQEYESAIAILKTSSQELYNAMIVETQAKEQLERDIARLSSQHEEIIAENEKARYLISELENRPPVRDTEKEDQLAYNLQVQDLEIERLKEKADSFETLLNSLSQEKIALEEEVQKSREILSRANEQDKELKYKIAELEETLNSFNLDEVETP